MSKTPIYLLKTRSAPTDTYHEYFSTFHDQSFEPVFVPVLEHHFNANALSHIAEDALAGAFNPAITTSPKSYSGLIFTSQRAVEAFTSTVDQLRRTNHSVDSLFPSSLPLYVVGPATSKSLRAINLQCPVLGEDAGNGEALAHYILKVHQDRSHPLLFLVGEQRRDIIPRTLQSSALSEDMRIGVEEVVVYETGVMDGFAEHFKGLVEPRLQDGSEQWVVVFSPTGCEAMLETLRMLDASTRRVTKEAGCQERNTKIVTIGPTTRDHLINVFGFTPDVCAPKPSPEGIGQGIIDFIRR